MRYFFIIFLFVPTVFGQNIVQDLSVSNILPSELTLSWMNSVSANSYLRYGITPSLELGVSQAGVAASPSVTLNGLAPSSLVYAQAVVEDVNGSISAEGDTLVFITQSLSSGEKKAYFTSSVNTAYAIPGNDAMHLPQLVDDTLVEYIQRATESIDMAIYNLSSSSSIANIAGALNDAFANGVNVRVIYNQDTGNTGISVLNPAIPKLISPVPQFPNGYGIMHHKFLIFDANSVDPMKPIVWTGSTNLTVQQINTDANNVVILQDQSLAKVYTMEFEEMWGSSSNTPNPSNSRFGPDKLDDTPHVLNVGGDIVEVYFSPSDKTTSQIVRTINSTTDDLLVNTMLITRSDLASAINFRHFSGVNVGVMVNTEAQTSQWPNLLSALNGRLAEYTGFTGTLHHKMMMGNVMSGNNPYVLTGSHNWSTSAEDRNDENTLIIYNAELANQYYQEFMARYEPIVSPILAVNDNHLVDSDQIQLIDVAQNDFFYQTVSPSIEIITPPNHGMANGSGVGLVSYLPNTGFLGLDSMQYRLCNNTIFSYCDDAWVYLNVDYDLSLTQNEINGFQIFPNPTKNLATVEFIISPDSYLMIDPMGRVVLSEEDTKVLQSIHLDLTSYSPGVYVFIAVTNGIPSSKKLVIE
jgi:phosphatidylserine/phosphatidylglycerophosphate/cardiolipin synthase-like enzyme